MPAQAAASANAKPAKATGKEKLWAMAPVARGAGRRVKALNSDAEERPTAGCAPACPAASAKLQGTIAPVPTPIRAKPATLAAKPPPAATAANPAAATAKDTTMMRRSPNRRRMKSALNRSVAWQAEKKPAPRPATAASFGASARRSSADHSNAAVSAAIETPMTIPSPIRAGAKERPRCDAATGVAAGSSLREARS